MLNLGEVATVVPPAAATGQWDAIVVGTGMGGGALGHRLVEAGLRVLFVEKGPATVQAGPLGLGDDPDRRERAGYWPGRVAVEIDGVESEMLLPLGSGVGGSTNLYSAALERFERSDIEAVGGVPHPTGGWPVPWSAWTRYYAQAERLLRVRGGPDPLSADSMPLPEPPAASAVDQGLARLLRENGRHPYRLHVGIAYRPGCTECGGYKCPRRCKSDVQTVFVDPALATGRAHLIAGCEVLRIDAGPDRVDGVTVRCGAAVERLSARVVVLAAGAYHSPALLLRSANAHWPAGLANRSGMVGRNLMFHANEWIAVWPREALSAAGPRKTLGFRDDYVSEGIRLGSVQSTGLTASFGNICGFLVASLERSPLRWLPGWRVAVKLAAMAAVRLFGSATIFVMLVEDIGYPDNRVLLDPADPARIRVRYAIEPQLRARARRARRLLKRSFRGTRTLSLQRDVLLNLGHACGTCRFGDDPDRSVLDRDCRAHGVENLYVVDASFMPSSGGTNPALTIAANALRVGDLLAARLIAERDRAARPIPPPASGAG